MSTQEPATPRKFTLHLGPCYVDNGKTFSSYQLLNANGYAVATCNIVDGKITSSLGANYVSMVDFLKDAMKAANAEGTK
jgi:hypothetical protein